MWVLQPWKGKVAYVNFATRISRQKNGRENVLTTDLERPDRGLFRISTVSFDLKMTIYGEFFKKFSHSDTSQLIYFRDSNRRQTSI